MVWANVAAAVAGPLIGGLVGKKGGTTTRSEIDYVKMRDNAEAAGFNPLTALRNGGGAGFQVTHHPALSNMGNAFGEAAQAGLAAYAYQSDNEQRAELEQELMRAQLERVQGINAHYARLDPPSAQAPTRVNVPTPALGQPGSPPWEAGEVKVTTPHKKHKVNPDYADAEAGETRYGDIIQEIFGWRNALVDTFYNYAPVLSRGYQHNIRSPNVPVTATGSANAAQYLYRKFLNY